MHNAYYIYCAKMKLQHIYANFVVVVVIVNVVTSFSPFSLSLSLSPAFSLFLLLIQCVFFFCVPLSRMLFWPSVCPGPVCSNLCKFFISLCGQPGEQVEGGETEVVQGSGEFGLLPGQAAKYADRDRKRENESSTESSHLLCTLTRADPTLPLPTSLPPLTTTLLSALACI